MPKNERVSAPDPYGLIAMKLRRATWFSQVELLGAKPDGAQIVEFSLDAGSPDPGRCRIERVRNNRDPRLRTHEFEQLLGVIAQAKR